VLNELIILRGLSSEACTCIRNALVQYLKERFPTVDERAEIKNKMCVVYVSLVRREYPERWPTAFSDLIGLVSVGGTPLLDMFLRILDTLDTEVVNDDINRSDEEKKKNTVVRNCF
jgi:hypothetical protein